MMPTAKFHADPLITVAVHKEQRNTHTYTDTQIQFYIYKILRHCNTYRVLLNHISFLELLQVRSGTL